jgi:hypothetical protein
MKEIKLSVNMESWRITNDTINKKEITEEQFHLADKGELTKEDKMEIFGMAVVWGYGLYGYEIYEEDGKYYAEWRQGDSCD